MRRLFSIFFILFSISCSNSIDTTLDRAASLMIERPDSAYKILSAIDRTEIRGKRAEARYALLYAQSLDKNWIDVDNDSLIRVAVDYYRNHGKAIDKAKAFYYSGVVYYNASDIDEAMKAFVKARIYAEKTDDLYLKGLICSCIGNLYYTQLSFDEAIQMYSSAIDAFSAIDNKVNQLNIMVNKGLALAINHRDDEAITCLEQAEKIAWELEDTQMALKILGSLAGITLDIYPSKIYEIKSRLFDTYKRYTGNVISVEQYKNAGNIYLIENKIDSAKYYYTKYLDSNPEISYDNIGFFAILSSLENDAGNYKRAYEYERLYSSYADSLFRFQKDNLIQGLERKYKTEYLQASYEALQSKSRYEILCFILALIIIGIVVRYIISYFRRTIEQRNQQLTEYESYMEEIQVHYSELRDQYSHLTMNVHVQNTRSQALFEVLGNRIQSLKQLLEWASKYERNPEKFYSQFKDHIKLASGKNRDLAEDVIAIANLTNGGIIDHLHKLYPSLSQHELCYCGFLSLGFSHECIRILYNHTNVYSIYTMRSKIRSKIGLINNTISLESYIQNLTANSEDKAAE